MIQYLGQNLTDQTVRFSVNKAKYEYWLAYDRLMTVHHLAHRISSGKAFAYAKRHALKTERIPNA